MDPLYKDSLSAWLQRARRFLYNADRSTITRATGHLTIVALLVLAGSFSLPQPVGATAVGTTIGALVVENGVEQPMLRVRFSSTSPEQHHLQQAALPYTARNLQGIVQLASADRSVRTQVLIYRAQPGDVIDTIATRFGLKPETIMYSNPEIMAYPDALAIDQEVRIPPVDGAVYTVGAGESLEAIAALFQVSPEVIASFASNNIGPDHILTPGQDLVIPGGIAPTPVPTPRPTNTPLPRPTAAPKTQPTAIPPAAKEPADPPAPKQATGYLDWPTSGGISQDCYSYHVALDIYNASGTPIYAADSGYVSTLETLTYSYGWYLIIDHGNGIKTRYAHLSGFNVSAGESVSRGQLIGWMGSTGKSTGPHLHFEVIVNGRQVCPWGYLPN